MPSANETNGSNGDSVLNDSHVTNGIKKTNGVNGTNGKSETNGANGANGTKSRTLHIPDLFGGILSGEPVENPREPEIGRMSEEWTKALTKMDPKTAKILTKANFAYLISLSAPQADAEAFRMAVDWCIWAFVFDDQYDEGAMRDKTIESSHEMIYTLSLMDDSYPPVDPKKYPLRYMFQSTWRRFQQVWLAQSKTGLDVTIPDYMETRRQSIGSYCLFVVVEWAHGIKLTQDIFDHPSVATCERAAADLTWLVNDVLSYKKDMAFGVEHNIICLLKRQGCSEQEAMDRTGEIMDQCQKDWEDAVANLPSWGEETDKEVQRYLGACRDVARANLWWSFKSGRYLNAEEAVQARTARILTL
ncbi:hypothetical protein EKO27_g9194 [Xylaria grammica]|uniref:Terpene synthase n=1 Tax=Xylaria grammica TaxID=363999 RepID=A0A439CV05_9PEZI|nr:hypothetical protein EKO27_g9194 [Xylaria grammica]